MVVLDDVHWADEPSVRLLHHLARFCGDTRLLILVTSRDTEHRHGPLLAALSREPAGRDLPLAGLPDSAVARTLADVVGVEVSDADVARVQAATAGNPFFVAEMGRLLVDRGASGSPIRITASVREAIDERLGRLSADCVPLLRAAAAIGREFPTTDLAAIAGSPVLRCLELLDEAAAAGFVEPGPSAGEHRFVHALVRDAVEATAGSPELVRLHRMAAETIEAFYGHRLGPRIFDLARHWAVAAVEGERGRAVERIERAGAEAMRALAYEEAVRLYRQALDVGAGELADADRCRLLLALGSALHRAGDMAGRLDVCLDAAALARALRRPDLLAEAALVLESVGPTDTELLVRDLCAEALPALDGEAAVLHARVAARYAEALLFAAWFTDSGYELPRRASAQALTLAQECGDSGALGAALRSQRLACASPEGLAEREDLAGRMVALGHEVASPSTRMAGHLWRVDAAFERGDLVRVSRELEQVAGCVAQIRGPMAHHELYRHQAVLAQAEGRFGDALRLTGMAFGWGELSAEAGGFHERAGLCQLIGHHIGHEASRTVEVGGYADTTAFERGLPTAGVIVAIANAYLFASVGRGAEAAAVYRSLGPVAQWEPAPHAVLCCYAFGIGVAVALGESDDVQTLREALSPYRGHHVVSAASQVAYLGPVEFWLGIAAAHLALLDAAVGDLGEAVAICASSGAAAFGAEARYELAGVLVRRGSPGDGALARTLLEACSRQASVLGMGPIRAKADDALRRLSDDGPLTRREWEVAGLVAEGLTNRDIARRLVVSERTAQTHVQHILTKLDLANRTQLTAWTLARRT